MNSSGWLPEFRCLSEEISRFLPGATCTMTPGGSLPLSRCIQNTTNSRRQPLREIIMLRLEVIQILQYSHALIASQGARSSIWSRLNSFRILCLLSGWFTNSHNRNISEIIDNLSQREIITETGLRSVNTLGVFGIFLTVRNDGGLRVLLSGLCYVRFELNCSTAVIITNRRGIYGTLIFGSASPTVGTLEDDGQSGCRPPPRPSTTGAILRPQYPISHYCPDPPSFDTEPPAGARQ